VNPSDNSLHCGGCGTVCGANQVCAGGACVALALGNGRIGTMTNSNPPTVAVAYPGSITDLQTKLQGTGAFSSVGFISTSTAPTLAALKAYDAVAVFTFAATPAATGDVLADYFEQGGGVVIYDYESQEASVFQLGGRFQTQYTLSTLTPSASWSVTPVTLGTINEVGSPLLNQVTTYGLKGSSPKHLPASAFNKNNPIVVALFSDNTPAVVRGVVASGPAAGRNMVEINSFGHSAAGLAAQGWDITTDGAKLGRNALLYSLPPLVTTAQQIMFGNQPLYTPTAAQAVTFTNTTNGPRTLTSLTLSGSHIGEFTATPASPLPAVIPAGGTFVVNVTFTPAGPGLRAATLNATFAEYNGKSTTLLTGTGL
jgi:hypothetical protein